MEKQEMCADFGIQRRISSMIQVSSAELWTSLERYVDIIHSFHFNPLLPVEICAPGYQSVNLGIGRVVAV
jgi:hypothetical protein